MSILSSLQKTIVIPEKYRQMSREEMGAKGFSCQGEMGNSVIYTSTSLSKR